MFQLWIAFQPVEITGWTKTLFFFQPEDVNLNVCRNVGKFPTFDVTHPWKSKFTLTFRLCFKISCFFDNNYYTFIQAFHFLKPNAFWMASRNEINFLELWHHFHFKFLPIPLPLKAYFCFHNVSIRNIWRLVWRFVSWFYKQAGRTLELCTYQRRRNGNSAFDCTTKHRHFGYDYKQWTGIRKCLYWHSRGSTRHRLKYSSADPKN